MAGEQVEHVVEEPDAGRAGAGARPAEGEREVDRGLRRSGGGCRRGGSCVVHSRVHGSRVGRRSPRRGRSRRAAPGQRPAAAGRDPDLGEAAPERARRQARGEARGAAGGQHVVGARDVVAERRPGAHEDAAGAASRAGPAPRPRRPSSSRCSGAKASAKASAASRSAACVQDGDRAGVLGRGRGRAGPRRSSCGVGRGEHDERARPVLGLGEQVEDGVGRAGVAPGHDDDVARAGQAVDPDPAEDLALGLGDPGVARAGDHVDRRRSSRCRRPARRRPGRRPRRGRGSAPASARGGEDRRVHAAVGAGRGARRRRRPRPRPARWPRP